MDLKHTIEFEFETHGKKARFSCESDYPLSSLFDISIEIRNYVLENLQKSADMQQEQDKLLQKNEEKAEAESKEQEAAKKPE